MSTPVLDVARQIAGGRGVKDSVERTLQLAALDVHLRECRGGDSARQSEGRVELQLEPQGKGIVTGVIRTF